MANEEFVNVGVLLVCPQRRYRGLKALSSFSTSKGKLRHLAGADGHFIRSAIDRLEHAIDAPEWFGFGLETETTDWAARMRGLAGALQNNVRLSEPSTTVTNDPLRTIDTLFTKYVGDRREQEHAGSANRTMMRVRAHRVFNHYALFEDFPDQVIERYLPPVPTASRIDLAYRNGGYHFFQLIPFFDTEDALGHVNAYRTTARDVRAATAMPELRLARFSILGLAPERTSHLGMIEHTLKSEDINLLDFERDLDGLAANIRRELAGATIL